MNVSVTRRLDVVEFLREKYQLITFGVYLALLALVVSRHEPWMDEAQAWLLAKDLGFKELFVKYLRYEGSPGLWHLVLMLPAKLGLPYQTINIISATFSALGVWLFLRYAPFPPLIKVLFPFTFFIFFQYGIVARSYCMIAPILFILAAIYEKKHEWPFIFVLLLGLLANISVHTFIIAGCIAFIHFIDIVKQWKELGKGARIRHLTALSLFGIIGLAVIYIIMTPPDQLFASQSNWGFQNFCYVTQKMIAGSLVMSEFSPFPYLYGAATLLVMLVTLNWISKQKMLLTFLMPLLLLSALFAIKYRNYWHQGILFLLWIFVLWLSFEKFRRNHGNPDEAKSMTAVLGMVLAVQVFWCGEAVAYDLSHSYSGSYSLAKYIKRNGWDKEKIFVSGWRNISVLPYFSNNIFYNHNSGSPHRFWNWSTKNVTSVGASRETIDTIECEQPQLVIFASDHIRSQQKITVPGYKPVAFFRGYLCWKTGLLEPECYLVFKKQEQEKEKIVYQNKHSANTGKNVE